MPEEGPGSPGGLFRRAVAAGIDWLSAMVVVSVLFGGLTSGSSEASLAVLGVFALQRILLTWLSGASFGQRIMGLRVAAVGAPRAGLLAVTVRTLLLCLVIPALVMNSQGRGLHDLAAGTVVVRA